ncbi:MAG: 30S ribosomal protein S20 [Bdellovibrionales bacterium]|nr:30S ribosomal protein S20 [Bdellovibrionales bacterium]
MANIKSAEKRARQIAKRTMVNKANRSAAKTAAVKALSAIKSDAKESLKAIADAASVLTKTAHSGSIPKRRAARKISRLYLARNKALNA